MVEFGSEYVNIEYVKFLILNINLILRIVHGKKHKS
jgi:hypothetical protein